MRSSVRLVERENTLSILRPQPHTTNLWEEKDKIEVDKKIGQATRKASALLLNPDIPTPSNRVTKIVLKIHREGHKGSVVLKSYTVRRRKRVPLSKQSTTSNARRHIRPSQCTAQVTLNHKIIARKTLLQMADEQDCTLKHSQLKNIAFLTTLSSCLTPLTSRFFLHGFTLVWGKTPQWWKMNYLKHLP